MLLYLAWRYGNEDPYRLYHSHRVGDVPPPAHPGRVRSLIYGFALHAQKEEGQKMKALAGRGM